MLIIRKIWHADDCGTGFADILVSTERKRPGLIDIDCKNENKRNRRLRL